MALKSDGRNDFVRRGPGFQGSENSGVEIVVYPQKGDPIVVTSDPVNFQGRSDRDKQPSIIAASTQKNIGSASGTWSFTVKPGRNDIGRSLFDDIVDDDWVDISFKRHARKYHVMRGLIDTVRRSADVAGSGATSTAFTITGRDFGKIWEQTSIWFNPFSSVNLGGAISQKVFSAMEGVLGNPVDTVTAFLRGMLEALGNEGQANWKIPDNLPNAFRTLSAASSSAFIDAVKIDTEKFNTEFNLIGLSQNWLTPQGNLWQLAKEWSDALFNELWVDLRRADTNFNDLTQDDELLVDDSQMAVFFRQKPFPILESSGAGGGLGEGFEGLGIVGSGAGVEGNSDFFKLPLFTIPREMIVSSNVGRGGQERYNAFFVAPQMTQELLGQGAIDLLEPLWSPDDIKRHGFRRFDVMTKYAANDADLLTIASRQRELVRDWYAMNPYLFNGTINLARGMPEIRVGVRARVPGKRDPSEDETYYVESVGHNWQFGQGTQTSLGVTRGWIGTDNEYIDALGLLASHYETPPRAQPEGALP